MSATIGDPLGPRWRGALVATALLAHLAGGSA